jgi:hypothetical protein
MARNKNKKRLGCALAHPTIAAVSLVLCATNAIGVEQNYTAAFEDVFNMTMPATWSRNYPATKSIKSLIAICRTLQDSII